MAGLSGISFDDEGDAAQQKQPRSMFSAISYDDDPRVDAVTDTIENPLAAPESQPSPQQPASQVPTTTPETVNALSPDELQAIREEALASGDTAKADRVGEIEGRHKELGPPGETDGQRLRRNLSGKQVMFDGKPVDATKVLDVADQMGVSPETILRSGTPAGKFEARLAKSVLGQTLLRAEAGLSDLAATALSLTDRAAGDGTVQDNLKRSQALRQEYLNFIEQGSDIESVLGERGNRIYSSVVQSMSKMAATGSVGGAANLSGQTAILSTLAAENLDTGLNDADDLGLQDGDRTSYALRKATIETGITYLMGRVGQRLGVSSVEEMLSPGMRQAAQSALKNSGVLKRLASLGGGVVAEAGEEVLVDAVSQLNEISETGASVDFERMIDAGIGGAVGGAAVNSVAAINSQLGRKLNNQNVEEIVKGVKAAEAAIENATTEGDGKGSLEKLMSIAGEKLTARTFAAATGIKGTSAKFREHFMETVNLYGQSPESQAETTTGSTQDTDAPVGGDTASSTDQDSTTAAEATTESQTGETSQTGSQSLTDDNGGVRKVGEQQIVPGPDPSAVVDKANTTSATRADMDVDRDALGLDPLPSAETKGWEDTLSAARQAGVPDRAVDLAQDIIHTPRAFSDVETAGIVVKAAEIKKQFESATKAMNEATDPNDARTIGNSINRLQTDFDQLSDALRKSGTEKGRALNAQKMRIDQNFDLITVNSRARAAKKGDTLTEGEKAKLGDLVTKHEAAKAKAEALAAKDPNSDEAIQADLDLRASRGRINGALNNMAQKQSLAGVLASYAGNMRTIMASYDLSAIGRQGIFTLITRPITAAKAMGPMIRAARSPLDAEKVRRAILARPNAELYNKHGLFLHDDTSGLSAREEAYASDVFEEDGWIARNLPAAAAFGRGSQRAYGTYLNQIRADTFDLMVATLPPTGQATDSELNKIARFVNAATGRGGYAFLDKHSDGLTTLFFAPRFVASRFEMITKPFEVAAEAGRTGTLSDANGAIAKEYARYMVGMTTVVGMILQAFGDEAEFSMDPTDADFMKLKFGDTRVDIMGGMAQPARLMGSLLALKAGNTDVDGDASLWRFIKTKLSPIASLSIEAATHKNAINQKVDPTTPGGLYDLVIARAIPLTISQFGKSLVEDGMDEAAAEALANIVGIGWSTYESRSKK